MFAKTNKKIKRVAFFGDAEAKKTDEHFLEAFNCAKLLAENGYIVINGGGPGVMLASSIGAKASGGKVEVVILNPKKNPANYEGTNQDNLNLADLIVTTENYPERLNKLVEIADAFVIFKGGTGTLSELSLVWELAKFEYGKHEPLIFVGKCWEEIIPLMVKELGMDKQEKLVYKIVEKPQEVLEALKSTQTVAKVY